MFNNFGFMGSTILKEAELERYNLHHPYVGSEHLLLSILKSNDPLKDKLQEYNLDYNIFKKELINIVGVPKKNIEVNLYTPLLKRILSNALEDAKENNKGLVTPTHLFLALLDEGEGIAIRIMLSLGINLEELYEDLKIKPSNLPQEKLELFTVGTILNNKVDTFDKCIGREKEVNNLIEVLLRKKKSNPLLIGDAGVGKTAIVEGLAYRIIKGYVPDVLLNYQIIKINITALMGSITENGAAENRIDLLVRELS